METLTLEDVKSGDFLLLDHAFKLVLTVAIDESYTKKQLFYFGCKIMLDVIYAIENNPSAEARQILYDALFNELNVFKVNDS